MSPCARAATLCVYTSDTMLIVLPLLGQGHSILRSAQPFTILPPPCPVYLYCMYTAMPDILCTSPAAQGLGRDLLGADMLSQAHLVGNFDYTELLQSRGRGVFREYSRTQCLLVKEANTPGPAPSIHKPGQLAVVLL